MVKRDRGKINAALALLVGAGLLLTILVAAVAAVTIWSPWRRFRWFGRPPISGPYSSTGDACPRPGLQYISHW